MVVHPLDQSISGLKCSYREILEFVDTLEKKAGSDGAAGMPNQFLVEWSSANPEKAKQIVSGAMSLDQLCLAHCVFAIQGLGDPTIAYELLDHSDKAVVAVGLRSLGRLNLKDLADKKRFIDECFKALSEETDQDVRSSAIESAFKTWEKMGQSEPYLQADIISAVVSTNKETPPGDKVLHAGTRLACVPASLAAFSQTNQERQMIGRRPPQACNCTD